MELLADLSIDITVEFKDNIFNRKLEYNGFFDAMAMRNVNYLTNMPVCKQYAMVGSYLSEFLVQTFEKGKEFSIVNLN